MVGPVNCIGARVLVFLRQVAIGPGRGDLCVQLVRLERSRHRAAQNVLGQHIAKSDVVITTAMVPGKQAPSLISEDMVKAMRPLACC